MAQIFYEKISSEDLQANEKTIVDIIVNNLSDEWMVVPSIGIGTANSDLKNNRLFLILIHPRVGYVISILNCYQENQITEENKVEFLEYFLISYLLLRNKDSEFSACIKELFQERNSDVAIPASVPIRSILIMPFISKHFSNSASKILSQYFNHIQMIATEDFVDISSYNYKLEDIIFSGNDTDCNTTLSDSEIQYLKIISTNIKLKLDGINVGLSDTLFFQELLNRFNFQSNYDVVSLDNEGIDQELIEQKTRWTLVNKFTKVYFDQMLQFFVDKLAEESIAIEEEQTKDSNIIEYLEHTDFIENLKNASIRSSNEIIGDWDQDQDRDKFIQLHDMVFDARIPNAKLLYRRILRKSIEYILYGSEIASQIFNDISNQDNDIAIMADNFKNYYHLLDEYDSQEEKEEEQIETQIKDFIAPHISSVNLTKFNFRNLAEAIRPTIVENIAANNGMDDFFQTELKAILFETTIEWVHYKTTGMSGMLSELKETCRNLIAGNRERT